MWRHLDDDDDDDGVAIVQSTCTSAPRYLKALTGISSEAKYDLGVAWAKQTKSCTTAIQDPTNPPIHPLATAAHVPASHALIHMAAGFLVSSPAAVLVRRDAMNVMGRRHEEESGLVWMVGGQRRRRH